MSFGSRVFTGLLLLAACAASAEVQLDLEMPGEVFTVGAPCWLRLRMRSGAEDHPEALLLAALESPAGDHWLYPGWQPYPPDLDGQVLSIPPGTDATITLVPPFRWPSGCGDLEGWSFLAVVLDGGEPVSEVAEIGFCFTDVAPTPTPVPPAGWAFIPAGRTLRGSPEDEMCREPIETQHQVILTRPFLLSATQVTRAEWVAVFGEDPVGGEPCPDCPVACVTWFDAVIYCNRCSQRDGLQPCYYAEAGLQTVFDGEPPVRSGDVHWDREAGGYRLPTDAEWEHACRAYTFTAYSNGLEILTCTGTDPNLELLGWYRSNSGDRSHPVGLKQPNRWGLYDMHGNVYEWCWDFWELEHPPGPLIDPTGPASGYFRCSRGGGWSHMPWVLRSGHRGGDEPGFSYAGMGFRMARARVRARLPPGATRTGRKPRSLPRYVGWLRLRIAERQ